YASSCRRDSGAVAPGTSLALYPPLSRFSFPNDCAPPMISYDTREVELYGEPIARAVPYVRSIDAPGALGPLSTTRAITDLPVSSFVTRTGVLCGVSGSATPSRSWLEMSSPQAPTFQFGSVYPPKAGLSLYPNSVAVPSGI